jgi:type II secretory pathway pseudopilin PulG
LTEILISILIMGIGMTSLAVLFPLGLLRLRSAARDSRTALAQMSALSEVAGRNLLAEETFVGSWYPKNPLNNARFNRYDPWSQDLLPNLASPWKGAVYRGYGGYNPDPSLFDLNNPAASNYLPYVPGPGLPVAYDPLFWATVHYNTAGTAGVLTPTLSPGSNNNDGRFGWGLTSLRPDPNPDNGNAVPSGHGLQRLTNFAPLAIPSWRLTYPIQGLPLRDVASDVFTSLDDIVFQPGGSTPIASPYVSGGAVLTPSPLLPDLSGGQVMNDLSYTWMFTGQQFTAGDYSTFEGSVVMFHNRPLSLDLVGSNYIPAGERVVEAAWGWSTTVRQEDPSSPANPYYGISDRTVLIRWPADEPDPTIAVGSWIADVTYERSFASTMARFTGRHAGQRCYWYQVVRRGDVQVDPGFAGDPAGGFRRMVLTLKTPVQAKTQLYPPTASAPVGSPFHVNAALVMPSVVNVFPASFRPHSESSRP